jgi:hypothetical protein
MRKPPRKAPMSKPPRSGVRSLARNAEEVLRDHLREGAAGRTPERIGDGAVEERRSVGGDERIEVERRAARLLLAIDAGVQAERRVEAARRVELDRDRERLPQLVEILFVRQREVLVEPFCRQGLGRDALLATPVRQRDRGADYRLRRMRHRRDAEAERQPQAHVALVAFDLDELQAGGVVHARASRIPLTYPIDRAAQVGPSGMYSKGSMAIQPS